MFFQVRLAHAQAVPAIAFGRFIDQQVGHDAARLDGPAFWRVVAGRRQLDGRIGRDLAQGLYGTLAERWRADDGGALVILQGAGDDFRGGSGASIDQHHQRHGFQRGRQLGQRVSLGARRRIEFAAAIKHLLRLRQLALGGNDHGITRKKCCRHTDSARHDATGIVAQVQHQALELGVLRIQRVDLFDHVIDGRFLELGDAQPGIAGRDHLGLHALHADFLAHDGEHQRAAFALARHGQHQLAAGLAAHLLDDVLQLQALQRDIVEAGDQVAGQDAGLGGRAVLDGRDDFHVAVFHAHFDADADKLALHAFAHFLEGIFIEVDGMRVQRRDHAGNGFRQEFLVFHLLDIIGLDQAEDVGQLAQLVERQRGIRDFLRHGRELQRHADAGQHAQTDQADTFDFDTHVFFASTNSLGNLKLHPGGWIEGAALMTQFKV